MLITKSGSSEEQQVLLGAEASFPAPYNITSHPMNTCNCNLSSFINDKNRRIKMNYHFLHHWTVAWFLYIIIQLPPIPHPRQEFHQIWQTLHHNFPSNFTTHEININSIFLPKHLHFTLPQSPATVAHWILKDFSQNLETALCVILY